MLAYYAIPAGFVFLILLGTFLADSTTPKTHLPSWIFVGVATVLWPLALPSIVWTQFIKPLTRGTPRLGRNHLKDQDATAGLDPKPQNLN